MSFKHINPGYSEIYNTNKATVQNEQYNPINGVSLGLGLEQTIFSLPSDCNEVWLKCGICVTSLSSSYTAYIGIGGNSGYMDGVSFIGTGICPVICGDRQTNYTHPIGKGEYHKLIIHCINGSSGLLEIFLDGICIYTYTGDVTWRSRIVYIFTSTSGTLVYINNIIISDTEITPTEEVYVLTPASTETTMSENSGAYVATEAGQTIKQMIDVEALKTKAGTPHIRISGLGICGNGFCDGEGLTKVTSLCNGVEKEDVSLSSDTNSYILSSWNEDLPIAELTNLQIGLKAKA